MNFSNDILQRKNHMSKNRILNFCTDLHGVAPMWEVRVLNTDFMYIWSYLQQSAAGPIFWELKF